MREDCVIQSLQALADHDRSREASPLVEARLVAEFRVRKMRRRTRWLVAGAAAAGLAAGILLTMGHSPSPRAAPARMPHMKTQRAPEIATAPAPLPSPSVVLQAEPLRVKGRRPGGVARIERVPHETFTDFFPLINPAPPFERGQLLRVNVPASAMRTVGLPVREEHLSDRIDADVLVGEEGMPRAIRFIRFDNN
jgi:hypothetical protein